MEKLLLISPPDNSQGARDIAGLSILEVLKIVAETNGLAFNASQPGKVYIGRKTVEQSKPTPSKSDGLLYPSGVYLERHPENNNEEKYGVIDHSAAPPLVMGPDDAKLSKHFSLKEFRPKSGAYDGVRVAPLLVNKLEQIRAKAGGTVYITSAYRPPAYNKSVGGVSNSTHIDGLAADIYTDHLTTAQLYDIANVVIGDSGGVGFYPHQGFVHVDVRGYRARW